MSESQSIYPPGSGFRLRFVFWCCTKSRHKSQPLFSNTARSFSVSVSKRATTRRVTLANLAEGGLPLPCFFVLFHIAWLSFLLLCRGARTLLWCRTALTDDDGWWCYGGTQHTNAKVVGMKHDNLIKMSLPLGSWSWARATFHLPSKNKTKKKAIPWGKVLNW